MRRFSSSTSSSSLTSWTTPQLKVTQEIAVCRRSNSGQHRSWPLNHFLVMRSFLVTRKRTRHGNPCGGSQQKSALLPRSALWRSVFYGSLRPVLCSSCSSQLPGCPKIGRCVVSGLYNSHNGIHATAHPRLPLTVGYDAIEPEIVRDVP